MKWRTSCLVAFLVACWVMGAPLAHALEYTWETIVVPANGTTPFPGLTNTYPYGINDAGHIVGYYDYGSMHGFLKTDEGYTSLDHPDASDTYVYGINNAGHIVGFYINTSGFGGFLKTGGGYMPLAYHPNILTPLPVGINNLGQMVGFYINSTDNSIWGWVYPIYGSYQALYLPTTINAYACGINNAGQIVGIYEDNLGTHGFSLMTDGTFTTLDPPGALETYAWGINDAGHIVGWYIDSSGYHGFLYDGSNYFPLDHPDATETYALDINNAGSIVGYYKYSMWELGFLATPVPLPGSILLLGSGLLGLGFWGRRRKRG